VARARLIGKALSTSQRYAELHRAAGPLAEFCQSLYPLLIVHADDFGRQAGDPFTIKHGVCPTSPRSLADVTQALHALHEVGLVAWYEVNGRKYLQIVEFDRHQQGLHKRTRSEFPDVSGNFQEIPGNSQNIPETPDITGNPPEILGRTEQNRTEGNGRESSTHTRAAFETFWKRYPRKERKQVAWATWQAANVTPADEAAIETDLARRCLSMQWRAQNGQFIPFPRTYLQERCWTDGFVEPTPDVLKALDTRPDPNGHYPRCETATVCRAKLEAEIDARRLARSTS
jgi:hypothetical protein